MCCFLVLDIAAISPSTYLPESQILYILFAWDLWPTQVWLITLPDIPCMSEGGGWGCSAWSQVQIKRPEMMAAISRGVQKRAHARASGNVRRRSYAGACNTAETKLSDQRIAVGEGLCA